MPRDLDTYRMDPKVSGFLGTPPGRAVSLEAAQAMLRFRRKTRKAAMICAKSPRGASKASGPRAQPPGSSGAPPGAIPGGGRAKARRSLS
jgi:hypothetical protein